MTQLWWDVARASGIVAWVLLSASVLWGLLMSSKALGRSVRPNWMLDLHRYLGGTVVAFVGIHVLSLVLDTYFHFGLLQVLVPFDSPYRPGAVAWGVVGAYMLVAVEITSLLRKRLSKRAWRLTHFLSFPLFISVTTHGLTSGTDAHSPAFQAAVVGVATAVAGLTLLRIGQAIVAGRRPDRRKVPVHPKSPQRKQFEDVAHAS